MRCVELYALQGMSWVLLHATSELPMTALRFESGEADLEGASELRQSLATARMVPADPAASTDVVLHSSFESSPRSSLDGPQIFLVDYFFS